MTTDRQPLLGPLGLRLAAAFLAVAVVAVGVLAALTIFAAGSEVNSFVAREQRADAQAAAVALADAFTHAGGWDGADLSPAGALAAKDLATLVVANPDGQIIAAPTDAMAGMMAAMHGVSSVAVTRGAPVTEPVTVAGQTVGYAQLRFPSVGLPAPERQVRNALWRTAVVGTALAAFAALIVALFVAGRVTRPLVAVTAAAERLSAGDRAARSGHAAAPGELGVLAASFDRMAENLEREDTLRRNLVTDVAHELRTPLTILRVQTDALLDGVSEASPETFESLRDEVDRITRVVGDLETLAAAEAATLDLHLETVDLAQIAVGAADAIQPSAEAAALTVEVDTSTAIADGDPGRLHQIAMNFLTNAVKFTPNTGRISVRTWADTSGAHLQVSDTGPGIPEAELPHVFERFWRGHAAQAVSGSGVGLAVAAELAAAHHGRVEAANGPKGGAAFTLTLPAGRSFE